MSKDSSLTAPQLKSKFIEFFTQRGHHEIPSSSLVPENDPTTLFISAGMHPLVPFLLGQPHPLGRRLVDVQKCVRTGDIDEVGDTYHHTFFEMLGNWSLGDYFKTDMIAWSYQFLTSTKFLGLDPNRLAVSCFAGDADAPKDEESAQIWRQQGIPESRIRFLPKKNNWWGPAGATGPCGPDSEMFYWVGSLPAPIDFDSDDPRWMEIWNDVFMQYNKTPSGDFEPLSQKNVDTGMGVERTTAILSGLSDNYLSPIWHPIIQEIETLSSKSYSDPKNQRPIRIIADHLKAAVFIIADGVEPSNKERGYVLRRLIRRAIRQGRLLGIGGNIVVPVAKAVLANQSNFAGSYPELTTNEPKIYKLLQMEEDKFLKTLEKGLRQIQKIIDANHHLSGADAFTLYESFGFPLEMIIEEASRQSINFSDKDINDFNEAKTAHQQQSQTLSAGKFKSGLADNSEIITKYHTATHLLHAALRRVLGDHVQQSGSNITLERLRFDFTHPEKLTPAQMRQVEELVNQKIQEGIEVRLDTMPFSQAQASGALAFFGSKYPETVSVYTIGDFSKEVCTGPHVTNTNLLGHFRLTKEESAGTGKRRLYAILE
jgi:alanyl-tRNA synthetase